MSLELTVCIDWRPETLLRLIVLLNGELEKYGQGAQCVQVSARCLEVGRVFHSGRTSVKVTAVEPDIRCHLVAIHLYFEFYCNFFYFDVKKASTAKAGAPVKRGH